MQLRSLAFILISATSLLAQTSRFASFTARVGTYTPADDAKTWNWTPSNRADAQDAYLNIYAVNNTAPYSTTANLATMTPGLTGKEYRYAQILALNYHRYYTYGNTLYLATEGNQFAQEFFNGIDTPAYINTTVQDALEANALMNALNQRISHGPDASWIGYTALAFAGAGAYQSLLGTDQNHYCPPAKSIENFIADAGAVNYVYVGHRSMVLGTSKNINIASVNTTAVSATSVWDDTFSYTFPQQAPAGYQGVLAAWPAANSYVPYQWFWPYASFVGEAVRMSAALGGDPDVAGIVVQVTRNNIPVTVANIRHSTVGLTWDVMMPDIANKPTSDQVFAVKIMNVYGGKTLEYSFTVFDPNTVVSAPITPKVPVINVATRGAIASQGRRNISFTIQGTEPVRVVLRALGSSLPNPTAAVATNPRIDLYRAQVASGNLLGTTKAWASESSWRLVQSLGLAPSTAGESAVAAILTPGTYTASLSGSTAGIVGFDVVHCDAVSSSSVGSIAVAAGDQMNLTVSGHSGSIQWRKNGSVLSGATNATLTVPAVAPSDAGIYESVINGGAVVPLVVGIDGIAKVTGTGEEVGSNIYVAKNDKTYDQVLLKGASVAVKADDGQITRTSYVDDDNDIVQVEFSGPGTLTLVVENAGSPALPVNYNQNVQYVKGHAGIVITGATENTNVSVFSVGRMTASNQALFSDTIQYDGIADIAYISISSANGKFGGVRAANANLYGTKGYVGLYAPGVQFVGPVYLGDIIAADAATPVILLGSSTDDNRITGGDLLQSNGQAVQVSGLTKLKFTEGTDSHGNKLRATANRGVLKQNGVDVTAAVVVNP